MEAQAVMEKQVLEKQVLGATPGDAGEVTKTNQKNPVRVVVWDGIVGKSMHILAYTNSDEDDKNKTSTFNTPVCYSKIEEAVQNERGNIHFAAEARVHAMPDCRTVEQFMDSLRKRGFAACHMETVEQKNPLWNFLHVFLSERSTKHFAASKAPRDVNMLAPKPSLLVASESDRDAVAEALSSNAPDSENFEDLLVARFQSISGSSLKDWIPGLLHFDRTAATRLDGPLKEEGKSFEELVHEFHFEEQSKPRPLPPVPSLPAIPDGSLYDWNKDWFQLRLWMPLQGKKRLFVLEAGGAVNLTNLQETGLTTLQEKGWISQPGQLVFFYNNFLEHAGVEAEDPPASGDNFPNPLREPKIDFEGNFGTSASAWLSRTCHASLLESCQRYIQKKEEDQKPQTPETKRQRIA